MIDLLLEERIEHQILQVRVVVKGFLDIAQEDRPDDASAPPHQGNASIIQIPVEIGCRRPHQYIALCIGDDFGSIQCQPQVFDEYLFITLEGSLWSCQHL